MNIHIAPSILSADFARLGEQVRQTEEAGADRVHVDVMDGHFVKNLSMGPAIVKSLHQFTKLPLEIHLMVKRPWRYIDPFKQAGASSLIVHLEACRNLLRVIRQVRHRGMKVGVAIKPGTAVDKLTPFLSEIDLALCMTVEPGYSGQSFLPQSPERISAIRRRISNASLPCEIEVDGGIDFKTAPKAVDAGANVLVAATAIFGHQSGPGEAVRDLFACFPINELVRIPLY